MRTTRKPKLILNPRELDKLKTISRSRTAPHREVFRAKILLKYMEGLPLTKIARDLNTNRPLVDRCINKAIAYGALRALKDLPGRGAKRTITDDAKIWVLSLACQCPRELGYAHETWTYSLLKQHIRANCQQVGYGMLSKIDKGVLHKILSQGNIKPHKVSYYLEKRDAAFEAKMAHVLQVYKEIALINEKPLDDNHKTTTLSYDEKPGIQAIKNIAPQLQPAVGKYPTLQRDYEYKRLGTVSLLAGIDLHTGKVIPLVRDRHRSREFIEFLAVVDKQYPADWKIKIVLDNHSCHVSRETKAWLLDKPGRFEFVFTPTHGSCGSPPGLNMIEMFSAK